MENKARLGVDVFDLPIPEIRYGYRSAVYFCRSKTILENEKPDKVVTMQVFQKKDSVLCGIDEALAILRVGAGRFSHKIGKGTDEIFEDYLKAKWIARTYSGIITDKEYVKDTVRGESINHEMRKEALMRQAELEALLDDLWVPGYDELEVSALRDGDEIEPWEPVMQIRGPLHLFVHLESVYLGVLARRTKVATNVSKVHRACNGKPLLFFADRFDHFATQGGDGFAAKVGGAMGFATDAMGAWWGNKGLGTMPHALIAAYDGNTVDATRAFDKHYGETDLIALVDFNNDCVRDALDCARTFGDKLWGVRLDTSENMVDKSINYRDMGDFKPTGVNPALVGRVRGALDAHGFRNVKIVVSGGFTAEKITEFEKLQVPVDAYAVGSSLLQGSCDFTADVVEPVAKEGRWFRGNHKLELA